MITQTKSLFRPIFLTLPLLLVALLLACGANPHQAKNPDSSSSSSSSDTTQKNKCDLYSIFNKKVSVVQNKPVLKSSQRAARLSFDTPNSEPSTPISKSGDVSTATFTAGSAVLSRGKQTESFKYIDLDQEKYLSISDKEAIETNSEWDVAFRGFEFYTNGGPYPGDLVVAHVLDATKSFDAFTQADLQGLTFLSEKPVDKKCDVLLSASATAQSMGYWILSSAPNDLNNDETNTDPFSANLWCKIHPPPAVQPLPKPEFYILKSKKHGWVYKLKVVQIDRDSSTTQLKFTIKFAPVPQ